MPAGKACSPCQTIEGFFPVSLRDGADRVLFTIGTGEKNDGGVHGVTIVSSRVLAGANQVMNNLEEFHLKILDHLVGEQFLAGATQHARRRGAIFCRKFHFENFALPDAVDSLDPERFEGALNGLALRIENSVLEGDDNPRFHWGGLPSFRPAAREPAKPRGIGLCEAFEITHQRPGQGFVQRRLKRGQA